jgi:YesN/AraC family two-component response regulator
MTPPLGRLPSVFVELKPDLVLLDVHMPHLN